MDAGGTSRGSTQYYRLGRVLVAGDETTWGSVVRGWLVTAGFEAEECGARDVLVAFERVLPDLAVIAAALDPPRTLAACKWIRSRSSIPLMVISQSATLDPVDVLAGGADLVLRSSVGERELVARVRGLLRRSPARVATRQPVVGIGDLVLDRERRRLQVRGRTLQLEGREFQLMDALITGGPKLTSRSDLREVLRQDDASLDGLVRRLRERLETVEGWRRIVTVRGVGFRMLEAPPHTGFAPATLEVIDLRGSATDWAVQTGVTSLDVSTPTLSSSTGNVG